MNACSRSQRNGVQQESPLKSLTIDMKVTLPQNIITWMPRSACLSYPCDSNKSNDLRIGRGDFFPFFDLTSFRFSFMTTVVIELSPLFSTAYEASLPARLNARSLACSRESREF